MAADPALALGTASVQVKADLDPLNRDLANARGQVEQFVSSASRSMDMVGTTASKAQGAQDSFNKSLMTTNIIYVDFNSKVKSSSDAINEFNSKLATTQTQTSGFADKLKITAESSHAIVDILKYGGLTVLLFEKQIKEAAAGVEKFAGSVGDKAKSGVKEFVKGLDDVAKVVSGGKDIAQLAGNFKSVATSTVEAVPGVKAATNAVQDYSARTVQAVSSSKVFNESMQTAGIITANFAQALRPTTVAAAATGASFTLMGTAAKTSFSLLSDAAGNALTWLGRLSPLLGPLGVAFFAVSAGIKAVEIGLRQISGFPALFDASLKAGTNVDYFQASKKAVVDLKLEADALTGSLKKLFDLQAPSESGTKLEKLVSDIQNASEEIIKGNKAALALATSPREQLQIIAEIITEMLENGQTLAALDLASKIWPPEVVERLARSHDYLQQMLGTVDKAAAKSPIDPQTVLRAKELQERLDAAYRSLSQEFIDLTRLGLLVRGVWVSVVEGVAFAAAKIGQLLEKAGEVAKAGQLAGQAPGATFVPVGFGVENITPADLVTTGPGGANLGQQIADRIWGPEVKDALKQLEAGLSKVVAAGQNPLIVQQQAQIAGIQQTLFGDASKSAKDYKGKLEELDGMLDLTGDKQAQLNKKLEEAQKKYEEVVKAAKAGQVGITTTDEAGKTVIEYDEKTTRKLEEAKEKLDAVTESIKKAAENSDAFNRALRQVSVRIAEQEAIAAVEDQGAAAIAKARTEAQLSATYFAEHLVPAAGEAAKKIKEIGDAAAASAQKMADARLKSDIAFETAQLGRTPAEQAVAARLRQSQGVNVDLQSADAKVLLAIEHQKNFNSALQSVSDTLLAQEQEYEQLSRAIGESAGAQERARITAQLYAAALKEGLDPAAEGVAEKIKKIADRAAEVTDKLARMNLQSEASFQLSQLGRTAEEQAVASQLRTIVGANNVAAAMKSADGQLLLFIEHMRTLQGLTANFASTFLTTFVSQLQQGAKLFDALKAAGLSALLALQNALLDMIARQLVAKLFGGLFGGVSGGGGGFNLFGGLGGAATGGLSNVFSTGAAPVANLAAATATGGGQTVINMFGTGAGAAGAGVSATGIPLSAITAGGLSTSVNAAYAPNFQGMVDWLQKQGYQITSLGGYNYRNIAGTGTLSQHAFGNAIDINPMQNPTAAWGGAGSTNLPPGTSEAARSFGLKWGGDWSGKSYDPMHFEVDKSLQKSFKEMDDSVKQATDGLQGMGDQIPDVTSDLTSSLADAGEGAERMATEGLLPATAATSSYANQTLVNATEQTAVTTAATTTLGTSAATTAAEVQTLGTASATAAGQQAAGGLGGGAGGLGGIFNLFGALAAKGLVFDAGRAVKFAGGGVVTAPTMFPMAQGWGLMGEAGPEAVMPLTRDQSGRLGVRAGSDGHTDTAAITAAIVDAIKSTPPQLNNRVVNAFDGPSFLSEALSSREGEAALLNFVRSRKQSFRQAMS